MFSNIAKGIGIHCCKSNVKCQLKNVPFSFEKAKNILATVKKTKRILGNFLSVVKTINVVVIYNG